MREEQVELAVERVPVEVILEVRTRVLRPHFAPGELARFEGDDAPQSDHYALRAGAAQGFSDAAEVIGCASVMRRDNPALFGDEAALQLRGMALDAAWQRRGFGAYLLEAVLADVALRHAPIRRIWCNAREAARSLYERAGFEVCGERFEIEGIGPHFLMARELPLVLA